MVDIQSLTDARMNPKIHKTGKCNRILPPLPLLSTFLEIEWKTRSDHGIGQPVVRWVNTLGSSIEVATRECSGGPAGENPSRPIIGSDPVPDAGFRPRGSHASPVERFQHIAIGARSARLFVRPQQIPNAHGASLRAPVAPVAVSAGRRRRGMSGFLWRQSLRGMQAGRVRIIGRRRCAPVRGPGIPGIIRVGRLGRRPPRLRPVIRLLRRIRRGLVGRHRRGRRQRHQRCGFGVLVAPRPPPTGPGRTSLLEMGM